VRGTLNFLALLAVVAGCGGAPSPEVRSATPPAASSGSTASGGASDVAAASDKSGAEVDRAVAAIKAKDFRSARAALEQALQKNPKNGAASYYMGVVLENLGDKAGAEDRYKVALQNAPDLADAAVNLGAIYLDANRWDDALEVTRKGLSRRSDDPALHANMAVALRGKGDKQGAAAHYEQAVKASRDDAFLRYSYGVLLLEMGNKPKAASELKAALASAGENRPMLASIGRLLGPAGAFADCVSALDKAIAGGDDPELRVRRGICRQSLKDDAGARSDFEAAVKLDAKFAPAHFYLAESLLAGGNAAQALKEFETTTRSAPDSELGQKAKGRAEAARKAARGK
jgi:tetratricopeptide (TPR) repeat protein